MKRVLMALVALLVISGCSSGGPKTITVFAAASLTESFTALGKQYEKDHPGTTVKFSFAGSSALAQQITNGAPADVFAAASPATMKTVTDSKGGTTKLIPRVFVRNTLEIAVPKGNPGNVHSLADLPRVKVVLCAPQVPCGAAAQKVLAGLNVTPVSQEQDVKAALTKVKLGEADAALVYVTDVQSAKGEVEGITFPESSKAINDYPIVALGGDGQAFVDFILSSSAQAVLTKAGFQSP